MKTIASIYAELEKSVCESLTWLWSRKTGHGEITGEKIQGRREVLGISTEVPQHLKRDQALSLWSRSTNSKTLDYQRTNHSEYQIELTQRKPLEYKTQHHPSTRRTLSGTPHLNNKQNKNTKPVISWQDYHLTQPCPSEEKQTSKQKLSTNLTLCEAYTNHWTKLSGAETKRKKEFNSEAWEKETSDTVS